MPDDNLFEEPKPDAGGEGDGNGEDKGKATPAGGSLSAKDLQAALEKELSPLADILKGFQDRLEAIETGPKAPDKGADKAAGGDDEVLKKFLADPEKFVKENYRADAAASLGPLFQAVAEDKVSALKEQLRTGFDDEFGEGKFEELISADLDQVIQALPMGQRISNQYLTTVVNGIKGLKFDKLVQAREENMEKRKAAPAQTPPGVLGGSRPRPKGGSLSEDEKLLLTKMADSGIEVDAKQYLLDRDKVGNSLDDYLALRKAAGNA